MNSNILFVILMASVVALAALILWLRDRRRDRIGMSLEARKASEIRLKRGVRGFYVIGEVAAATGVLFSVLRHGAYARDISSVAAFAIFLWLEWKRWTSGMRRTKKRTFPETAGAPTADENWMPPSVPPPIG